MSQTKPVLLLFLGAGFSAYAGAPVMSEFLSRARERLPENLLRSIDPGFYCAGYATGEWDNLETAYGAAVFRQAVFGLGYRVATRVPRFTPSYSGPNIGEVVEGFERAIACLYGEAVLEEQERWVDYHSDFFRHLLREYHVGIVTTNYDLVVETALRRIDRASTYSVSRSGCGLEDCTAILKLHGSVNWPWTRESDPPNVDTDAEPVKRAWLVPPTWKKDRLPAAIWRAAVDLMGRAEKVLIVGHSFPATDVHLDYLFAEGMSTREGQPERKRVTVADIDVRTAGKVCSRFRRYQTVEHAVPHGVPFEEVLSELETGGIVL